MARTRILLAVALSSLPRASGIFYRKSILPRTDRNRSRPTLPSGSMVMPPGKDSCQARRASHPGYDLGCRFRQLWRPQIARPAFFEEAAKLGDLTVPLWPDTAISQTTGKPPSFPWRNAATSSARSAVSVACLAWRLGQPEFTPGDSGSVIANLGGPGFSGQSSTEEILP